MVALESDFARVQGIVEEGVHALSARPSASSMGWASVLGILCSLRMCVQKITCLACGDPM